MSAKTYFIIDPILRGSRLQLTYYFIESLHADAKEIYLFTRNDYRNDHFAELIGDKYSKLKIVKTVELGDTWIRSVKPGEFKSIAASLVDQYRQIADKSNVTVFFAAIDDYYFSLFLAMNGLRAKMKCDFVFLRYRINFMISKAGSTKQALKNLLQKILLKHICRRNDLLLIMDERAMSHPEVFNFCALKFLPEPWEGSFGQNTRSQSREVMNLPVDDFIFLTIGKQNKRKGLLDILKAFKQNTSLPTNAKLLIVGKIEEEIIEEATGLIGLLGNRVVQVNRFIDESDLAYYYDGSDCVLLPYSLDFQFTSGVLTRAAASNTPVITTNHGVVGYRVTSNKLGLTYASGDYNHLSDMLMEMIRHHDAFKHHQNMSENILNGRIDNFKNVFKNIIG